VCLLKRGALGHRDPMLWRFQLQLQPRKFIICDRNPLFFWRLSLFWGLEAISSEAEFPREIPAIEGHNSTKRLGS
jgi:hypothetical protein